MLAGDLAGGVSAHSVGNDVEVVLVGQHEGVLVVGSLHPHVSVPNCQAPELVTSFPYDSPWNTRVATSATAKSTKPAYTRAEMCQGNPENELAAVMESARELLRWEENSRRRKASRQPEASSPLQGSRLGRPRKHAEEDDRGHPEPVSSVLAEEAAEPAPRCELQPGTDTRASSPEATLGHGPGVRRRGPRVPRGPARKAVRRSRRPAARQA